MHPEERARQQIDELLTAAGWVLQDQEVINLVAVFSGKHLRVGDPTVGEDSFEEAGEQRVTLCRFPERPERMNRPCGFSTALPPGRPRGRA